MDLLRHLQEKGVKSFRLQSHSNKFSKFIANCNPPWKAPTQFISTGLILANNEGIHFVSMNPQLVEHKLIRNTERVYIFWNKKKTITRIVYDF